MDDAELNVLKTAVDVKMANENPSTVIAVTTATNDMTSTAGGFDLYPQYMRGQTTNGTYTLASVGTETRVTAGY